MTESLMPGRDERSREYIEIDYLPLTEDPGRIFRAMAKLLDAFHEIDRDLANASGIGVESVLILERIEAGSLRAIIRTGLRQLDDEALKNLDWKPLIGQYLVRAKHTLLGWLEDKQKIESRADLLELQRELINLAPTFNDQFILTEPIPPARLLEDLRLLVDATNELREGERVIYVSDGTETEFDIDLQLSSEQIEELLTQDVFTAESRISLLIKKPDYLGNSMWEFKHEDRLLEARIMDDGWLDSFRAGRISLRPGDALDAQVRSEFHRGFEGNIVGTHHYVLTVYQVVHQKQSEQPDLLR